MSKLLVKFRLFALLTFGGLSLSACCMMCEAEYNSSILVEFPDISKETALQLALEAARDQGYRRGTIQLLDGKPFDKVCLFDTANFDACRDNFYARAQRVEARVDNIDGRLRVWTEKIMGSPYHTTAPVIIAVWTLSGAKVRFFYSSFAGPMNDESKADFYRLKKALIDRWGDKVSTEDEPNEIEP
jgi:hypothetical protein